MDKLTAMRAQLEDTRKALEEERNRSRELSAEIDAFEERADLGHGVFTFYLIRALKGEADVDGDGLVTVDEAYGYVSDPVPKATSQEQHPVRKGAVEGQLVLGIVP